LNSRSRPEYSRNTARWRLAIINQSINDQYKLIKLMEDDINN